LDLELVFVRGATTAVQALLANQIHFIFSVGPQMPRYGKAMTSCSWLNRWAVQRFRWS
jgi:hypothetical protein